jgi:uncharacterized protein with gpF-like domain
MATAPDPFASGGRERFRADMERWKQRAEAPYARYVNRILRAASLEAASAVENGYEPLTGPILSGGLEVELGRLFRERNAGIARAWGQIVDRSAKSAWAHERKTFETDFEQWLARWVAANTARKVTQVSDTTRNTIRRAVQQAVEQEASIPATARLIRDRTRIINAARSLTIARTEVNQASNAATLASADTLDLVYRKQWAAAQSERTREDHLMADGQTVDADAAFSVGGEQLMHPGDPSGSAGQVINCRCASLIIVE